MARLREPGGGRGSPILEGTSVQPERFIPPGPNRHFHEHTVVVFDITPALEVLRTGRTLVQSHLPAQRLVLKTDDGWPVCYRGPEVSRGVGQPPALYKNPKKWRGHLGPWISQAHSALASQVAGVTRAGAPGRTSTGQIQPVHALIFLKTQSSQPPS